MNVKIATYNMKNLFDDFTEDGSSAPKPDAEVRALVKTIDRAGADIIAAQEVESSLALEGMNDRLAMPYEHVHLVKGNSGRGIHLGYLSRFPLTLKSHKDEKMTYENGQVILEYASEQAAEDEQLTPLKAQRDILFARAKVNNDLEIGLFNIHLKSQRDYSWLKHRAADIRAAESRAVARIVRSTSHPHTVILGDFNEKTGGWPIRPITEALEVDDPLFDDIESQGEDAWTYHPFAYRGRIDYILLGNRARSHYRNSSIKIHGSSTARRASDHYPVSLRLDFQS